MRALLVLLKCASCLVHTRFHAAPRRVALRAASDAASDAAAAPARSSAAAAPARGSAAAAPAAARRKNDTLTTEGLGKMLAEVRAHYREPFAAAPNSTEAVAEAARVKKRLLRTRFQDLELDRCAVGKSAIHGRGLFATRDIAPGELVTLYPGDALLSWPDGDAASRSAGCEIKALFGSHVPNDEQTAEDLFVRAANARAYELPTSVPSLTIVGDPARDADPSYLGHLANDGAAIVAGDEASRAAYAAASAARANADHWTLEGAHHATVATRPIAAGDEVLVSYGEGYWLSRSGFAAKDEKARARAEKKSKRLPGAGAAKAKKAGGGFG